MAIFKKELLEQLDGAAADHAPRHTVLLVDDKDANISVMAAILRPHFNLLEARDGEEALAMVRALPDPQALSCIVSDHRMPRLTGVGLFEQVRPLAPAARRILVTGYMDLEAVIDAINKAQVHKFIAKPFDARDFLLAVHSAVLAFEADQRLAAYHRALAASGAAPDLLAQAQQAQRALHAAETQWRACQA